MDYKKLSFGLGIFSVALGAAELVAGKRIARGLDAEGHSRLVRGFGIRELVAGAGLLAAPANSIGMWNRVAGDGLDLAALAAAARTSPRNRLIWASIAFVAAAGALDILVARGLDRSTGRAFPKDLKMPARKRQRRVTPA